MPTIADDVKVSINDSGQIAFWHLADNRTIQAFLWQNHQRRPLGALPGDGSSVASDINSRGDVVGWSVTGTSLVDRTGAMTTHAFLYSGGHMQNLGTLGGKDSLAFGINDSGDVVGCASVGQSVKHAFVYRDGKMTDLGSLPSGLFSAASAINNSGVIVGAGEAGKMVLHAVMWPNPFVPTIAPAPTGPNGQPIDYSILLSRDFDHTDLARAHAQGYSDHDIAVMVKIAAGAGMPFRDVDQLAQDGQTFPAIADRYNVRSKDLHDIGDCQDKIDAYAIAYDHTGEQALRNRPQATGMIDLGTLPGGKISRAIAINNKGDVAGYSTLKNDPMHGFIYTGGHMLDLGTIGSGPIRPDSINDSDQIVGMGTISGFEHHAFIYQNGKIEDLNNLIPADSEWILREAYSINNEGEIVCSATPGPGSVLKNPRESHMVLLEPIASAAP